MIPDLILLVIILLLGKFLFTRITLQFTLSCLVCGIYRLAENVVPFLQIITNLQPSN